MNYLQLDEPFVLEAGGALPGITIAYHTYGRLNADGSNVVWVCHALTANSDVVRWWPGVVGEHGAVRPEDYFIVCANILGSCYGSTGPVGAGPGVGEHGVGMSGDVGERTGGRAEGRVGGGVVAGVGEQRDGGAEGIAGGGVGGRSAGGAGTTREQRAGGTAEGIAGGGAGGAEGVERGDAGERRTGGADEVTGFVGADAGSGLPGRAASFGGTGERRIGGEVGESRAGGTKGIGRPAAERPLYADFPMITVRDMVRAHILLRQHLGIGKIHLLMGGSMGGYQALEWVVMEPEVIGRLFLIATSPTESAWGIAVHTAQRLAIEADASWRDAKPDAGRKGLKAARAIGILTYRNYGIMVQKQTDPDAEKLDGYRASSYIEYQGKKLVERFSAHSYWLLTKAMDSHNIARGRGVGAGKGGSVGSGSHSGGEGQVAGGEQGGLREGHGGSGEPGVNGGQAASGEHVGRGGHGTVEGQVGSGEHVGGGGYVAGEGGRKGWSEDVEAVLRGIRQKTLVIGITSDILCPFEEQRHLAAHLPDARLIEIDSAYGHDGFMVEGEKIASHLREWLAE